MFDTSTQIRISISLLSPAEYERPSLEWGNWYVYVHALVQASARARARMCVCLRARAHSLGCVCVVYNCAHMVHVRFVSV